MRKEMVIQRLCALSSVVGGRKYHHHHAHDCFCVSNEHKNFQFEEQILLFIEQAVYEKMLKECNDES